MSRTIITCAALIFLLKCGATPATRAEGSTFVGGCWLIADYYEENPIPLGPSYFHPMINLDRNPEYLTFIRNENPWRRLTENVALVSLKKGKPDSLDYRYLLPMITGGDNLVQRERAIESIVWSDDGSTVLIASRKKDEYGVTSFPVVLVNVKNGESKHPFEEYRFRKDNFCKVAPGSFVYQLNGKVYRWQADKQELLFDGPVHGLSSVEYSNHFLYYKRRDNDFGIYGWRGDDIYPEERMYINLPISAEVVPLADKSMNLAFISNFHPDEKGSLDTETHEKMGQRWHLYVASDRQLRSLPRKNGRTSDRNQIKPVAELVDDRDEYIEGKLKGSFLQWLDHRIFFLLRDQGEILACYNPKTRKTSHFTLTPFSQEVDYKGKKYQLSGTVKKIRSFRVFERSREVYGLVSAVCEIKYKHHGEERSSDLDGRSVVLVYKLEGLGP